jgi:hypothetical protein
MSDCLPVLIDGKAVWYADLEDGPVFYTIDGKTGAFTATTAHMAESMKFNDVAPGDYFFDAVQWAFYSKPQVTDGECPRADVILYMWRALTK